ncbi:class I adenylate-forming enzyme family protein [Micromonospora sagamiensis]|uniref:Acyl-CoA synthetase (AMP-forming)/AMP-acid ligase II n=1 Tax=Micromonospora sagamiensis TaxID=47875 RepID=A0A562WL15_9ACTN|nr:class I adenylate-forming enzyme family protein [Micromonospora sagamiensis]TWJ30895.1 acyl-CoA synthetase (AMP-forming)/AMP-acid ligase II [Micromonospora sagamiensis]BCL16066.1 putative fatty-acid-CoA ligase FadD [Micromonospora sagamiensis]
MIFRPNRPLDIDPSGQAVLDIEAIAQCVRKTAGALSAAGVRPGDRFAVYKDNHFDCLLLAAAGIRIGAIPVMLSGLLPTDSTRALLQRVEPRLLVSNRQLLENRGSDGSSLTSFAERTLCLDEGVPDTLAFADLYGSTDPSPVARRDDELMMLTHTSGTTGIPKLIMYTPAKLQGQMARLECRHLPPITFHRNDTVAMFTPYVHARAFTWIYSVLTLSPTKVLVMSDSDPEVVGPLFQQHRPTVVEALPIDYFRMEGLARDPRNDAFSSVRMFINNFDAVRWATIRPYLNASRHPFPLWREGYGQSETGGMGMTFVTRRTANIRRDQRPGPRKVGRPMPGFVQLKVVDPKTFEPVPDGQPGLVLARTRARCAGYYQEPERWNEKAVGEWWNTGDIGIKTRTGALKLIDREVNYAPGLNCLEQEDVIVDNLPAGHDVALLPVSDGPPVPIVATPDGQLDGEQWRNAVRKLPELAEPIVIAFKDMPRTGTGKIIREELRRRYLNGAAHPGTGRWT